MSITVAEVAGSVAIGTKSGLGDAMLLPVGWLLCAPLVRSPRRRKPKWRAALAALAILSATMVSTSMAGCADGAAGERVPYTPPGTYVYQVTATATTNPSISSSVLLTVTVR